MGRIPSDGLLFVTGALSLAACQIGPESDLRKPDETVATAEAPPRTCATVEPVDTTDTPIEPELFPEPPPPPGSVLVDVYFNIIFSTTGEGKVTDETIDEQLRTLDDAFAGTPFLFRRAGVTRTERNSWFTMGAGSAAEASAKSVLHRGTAEDLNIYTASPSDGTLGWSSLPDSYQEAPLSDGVVLHYQALSGGLPPFNEGDTAVHEVGHWLGLFHTFRGGCSKHNDFVADTPAEDTPAPGCQFGRDSCTGELFPGADPIENFMGFADDACMVLFTPGQTARMETSWISYRLGN